MAENEYRNVTIEDAKRLKKITRDGDLTAGPLPKTPRAVPRPMREIEEYSGEIKVSNEGKFLREWPTKEVCGIVENKKKCKLNLVVVRNKKATLKRDSAGFGGYLDYDDNDTKYFLYCPSHGPSPPVPEDRY